MPKIDVQVDGVMVGIGLLLVGATIIYLNKQKVLDAVNPTKDTNVIYKGAVAATPGGQDVFDKVTDYTFGAFDLFRSLAFGATGTNVDYAKSVYGISDPFR